MNNRTAKKTTEERFNYLHELVTDLHIDKLESGEVNANDLKAAGEWLVKNGISGIATPKTKMGKLLELVPDVDDEEDMVQEA